MKREDILKLVEEAGWNLDLSFSSDYLMLHDLHRYTELVESKWKAAIEDLRDAYKHARIGNIEEADANYDLYLKSRSALEGDE